MRTTITINDKLYKALKRHALDVDETISALVEDAVKYQLLEDLEDIETAEARKNEPTYSYDEFAKILRDEGLI